ncbi:MAG: capsular biosynthesis protein [Burkholderiales bacterium RIFCSPLOWO2_12_67_14]|nr:MAG: capsular biosynthesis protein [Burkholderiales bacterium RIFCSPLOWO2_02_FULL_67_64]OGB40098.1 MAG: capsular biosynthesis protein [Burkholderiales bacterium RIFCSPLOWO2_12_67_14]OGB49755.1 MAG: capsular biosynthesis protein [Burkholderiales bacterium RIFCSPHIGHO2_12_FULL_67_38]OGB95924.1 MAG: capsular biosynthesis protein [Burkholderiales bacterium RIFCSPLOWO2_12_FULL_67_210]
MLNRFALPILAMPRPAKRVVVLAVDASLCVLTVWLAYYLRLGDWVKLSGDAYWQPMWAVLVSLVIALPIFVVNGFYRAIFRYSGLSALVTVMKAIAVYGLLFATVFTAIGIDGVPRTVGLIQPMLLLLTVGASRMLARFWLGGLYQNQLKMGSLPRVLIYGAGNAGRQLAAAMSNSHEMRVVGFLDDDDRLHGHVLNGLSIYSPADLPGLVNSLQICTVLLAIPSASRHRRNEMIEQMLSAHVQVRTLPSVSELAQGTVSTSDLRELDIDDLLGRDAVSPNHILLGKNIKDKVVMVTGAGGSIGRELCRQILAVGPDTLLLIEQSEFALYEIHQELQDKLDGSETILVPLLASVRDPQRLREIMSTWKPDTVYHAAAYKHVPLVEHNPVEGIKNNTLGTLTAAQVAAEEGVSDFVLISTDKAVRPTNIMGASKRLAEMALQALAVTRPHTRFSMVRFGNVLGSSGSVVPKFRRQIRDGGPLTVTHPEMTRYFMTIPEAAQLVIQAGAMAKGGDVFVLDMGDPVKILDLATRMIELSGLSVRDEDNPTGDIAIEITGLRPGEKLYEELLIGNNPQPTPHARIMKATEDFLPWAVLREKLVVLEKILDDNDAEGMKVLLTELVSGYQAHHESVDLVNMDNLGAARYCS